MNIAAVLTPDGYVTADGHTHQRPADHFGDLVAAARALELGWTSAGWRSQYPQVWVSPQMLQEWGFTATDLPRKRKERQQVLANLLTDWAPVAKAVANGYQVNQIAGFTSVAAPASGPEPYRVYVVLADLLESPPPLLDDDPSPQALARRIALFCESVGAPWAVHSGAKAGFDYLRDLRPRETTLRRSGVILTKEECFAEQPSPVVQVLKSGKKRSLIEEVEFSWKRPPTKAESAWNWVHRYDRNASHLRAMNSLEVGIGDPVAVEPGTIFDPHEHRFAVVQVDVGKAPERYPHLLAPNGRLSSSDGTWAMAPTLAMLTELTPGASIEIKQGWVWPVTVRLFDQWYERIKDARIQVGALKDVDPDFAAVWDTIKNTYVKSIGMMGSYNLEGQPGYAPVRRWHIIAAHKAQMIRTIHQIGMSQNRWPLLVAADAVHYASDQADPIVSWPGKEGDLDPIQPGKWKWEATAPVDAWVRHFITAEQEEDPFNAEVEQSYGA